MPVYSQAYRGFDGPARRSRRWQTVAGQELRLMFRSWAFRGLFGLGVLSALLRVVIVVSVDVLPSETATSIVLPPPLRDLMAVNETMFFDFVAFQGPLVLITTLLAGSGMVCNDVRYNLMGVYFSKPLTWGGYVVGKAAALMTVGLLLTAAPALVLLGLHNLFLPGMATLGETLPWVVPTVLFSLAIVAPCTLGVLASSALVRSQRSAGVGLFTLLLLSVALGEILHQLLHPNFQIASLPMAVRRVGQHLFHQDPGRFDLHWGWSLLYVGAVCLISAWITCRKVRRAEGTS